MNKLSAVIITYNEERNIKRCLDSLTGVADEIVVVDSFSTDRTEEICKSYNMVKFYKQKWLGYSSQKNYANSLASNELLFSIDADEVVSPELQKSIIRIKETATPENAYEITRLTNYCGKWIKHSGWYPDKKIRIWFKNEGEWQGVLHEIVKFNNPIKIISLKGDLYHYSYHSISQHIQQIDKFTDIGAKYAFNKGKKSSLFKAIYKSTWKFIRDYFIKLGVLDGYYGFVVCRLSAMATFLKYIKLKELTKK